MKRTLRNFAMVLVCGELVLAQGGMAATSTPAPTDAATPAKSGPKISDLFPDEVVAKGKGVSIKRSQLDDAMVSIKSTFAARGQDVPPDEMHHLEQQVLDRLIQVQILLQKATDQDKATGKDVCQKRMEAFRTRAGSEEAFTRQLKSVGTTPEELQSKMAEESTAEAVLERELNIKVSDDAVKKFYDENPSKFEQPEMVRASHILISTRDEANKELPADQKSAKRKKAEDVLKRARAGEDFAKLAKENSDDPGSKDKGGEYQFARGQMVPEFETAAFSLKTNQISDIVTTTYGFHIIKLSEKIPAKKIELAKVSPDVKEFLKQEEMKKHQQDLQTYLDKLKKDAGVEILDENLKPKQTVGNDAPQILPPATGNPKPVSK
ncbi:MAG TPA: peptidylprolyl isomerase [Candidatus Dormibacteraeota bacterium]|nr:peptidylprolyl isomerase [Candidatus Dormibacteraeota bacterium]